MVPEEMWAGSLGRGDLWSQARRILRQRKWWILSVFLAVAIPALWKAYGVEPRFTSSAIILMEHSADNYPVFREWVPSNSGPILFALLRSHSVAEEVVESLPKATFEELLSHRDERDYAATLVNLYQRLRGVAPPPVSPRQLVIQELQRARVRLSSRGGGLVEVEAFATSPQAAVDIVGAYVEVLRNRARSMNREQVRALRDFMESTQANVGATLKEAEQALASFRKERGILYSEVSSQADLVRLAQLEDSLAEVQVNEKMVQARLAFIRNTLAQVPEEPAQPKASDPPPAEPAEVKLLQARLGRLEGRYIELLDRYTEQHPLVKKTKAEMEEVRGALEPLRRRQARQEAAVAATEPESLVNRRALAQQAASLEAEIRSLQVRKQSLQTNIQAAKTRVTHLSSEELEYARLKRTADIQRNMFTMLQEKIQAANARGQGEMRSIRVIEPPVFPVGSSSARSLKMAFFGMALGVLMGLGVALALDYLDDSVRTEAELEALVEAPVLGYISRMTRPKALPAPSAPPRLPEAGRP